MAALSLSAGGLLVSLLAGRRVGPGARSFLAGGVLTGVLWLVWQGGVMTGQGFPQAQWLLLTGTGFGRAMAARIGLLLLALALGRWGLLPLLAAIGLQPLLGHGAAAEWPVALSGASHALAGALWVGALPWLWLLVRSQPEVARRFSPLGILLVLVLGGGIAGQWSLIGGLPGLFGTTHGHLLLAKAALLTVMLACAGLNGLWFAPDGQTGALRRSIGVEMLAGGLVLFLAALAATQVPGAHGTVVWPFEWRPVPGLWQDDFLRGRLLRMAVPVGLAGALILVALSVLRYSRILASVLVLVAAGLLWRMPVYPAAPFLRPAVPTTFQMADTRRNTVSLIAGQGVFARDCADCHGPEGGGAGPRATGDPVWPPDLTAPWFLNTPDGEWFWHIRHGMTTPEGLPSMPGNPALSDAEIWQVVDFLRANASARSLDAAGRWLIPPMAPVIRLRCEGRAAIDLSRPGGRPVYWGPLPPGEHAPDGTIHLDPALCGTQDEAGARAAIALLTAGRADGRAGLLVDPSGHLRRIWDTMPDSGALASAVTDALANPVATMRAHH
ncbi:CopD family protein [Paenirhodobacter sp.]|uniref:CopD family protein n=1 Tax=Paenirhodobacter sp. TaxID=1965326 RepID=UPI003B407DEA